MARRMPPDRDLKRGKARSQPKSKIIVFCEGSVTEPDYIKAFANSYRNGLVLVEPIGGVGVPKSVVKAAVARKADLILEAKSSKKTGFEMYFEVWAAFDRDSHEIEEAFDMARANQIGVVFSNPCFEIWPLLHLHAHTSHIERGKLQRLLKAKMGSYDHKNNPVIDYQLIESEYELAKTRALQLERSHEEWQTPKGNPYTDFHSLLESIKKNGQA